MAINETLNHAEFEKILIAMSFFNEALKTDLTHTNDREIRERCQERLDAYEKLTKKIDRIRGESLSWSHAALIMEQY